MQVLQSRGGYFFQEGKKWLRIEQGNLPLVQNSLVKFIINRIVTYSNREREGQT